MIKGIQKLNYYVVALLFVTFGFVACEQGTLTPIVEDELVSEEADDILVGRYTKSIEVFDAQGINSVQLTIATKDKGLLEKYDCNTISLIPKSEIGEGIVNDDRAEQTEDVLPTPSGSLSENLDNAIIIKVESQNLQESTKEFDININIDEQLEDRNTVWYFWYGSNRRAQVTAPNVAFSRYFAYHYIWNPSLCGGWCYAYNGALLYRTWRRSFYHVNGSYHGVYIGHENSLGTYCSVTFYNL